MNQNQILSNDLPQASSSDVQELTTFLQDGGVTVEPMPGETVLPSRGNEQHTDARSHSILTYLQREQLIKKFDWTASHSRNQLLLQPPIRIPDALFTPMIKGKLDGFTSFRATAVVRLEINSQPFQAGRLLMYAVPMPSLTDPRGAWLSKHVSMAQALHNVQMDIASQTEVQLKIPFISPFNSYDLIHGEFPWADLYISVYSPLNETEQTTLQCLLWLHFEDIELGAPTSAIQRNTVKINDIHYVKPVGVMEQAGDFVMVSAPPKEATQSEVQAVRTMESTGNIISNIGNGAVRGWNTLGNTIPFLKPITNLFGGLAGTATSILSPILVGIGSIGKIFGFSKPIMSHAGSTVVVRPSQYFGNIDGTDQSHVLALDVLNAVDVYPGLGGTNLSETNFDFLKSIPQLITGFCYGINTNYGTELKNILVSPTALIPADFKIDKPEKPLDTTEVSQPTILSYITSPFLYWTGSLVYTLRVVKTTYHSGRIEISYHPFATHATINRFDYVYRLILDLEKQSEISFSVPFISPTPWKTVDSGLNPLDAGALKNRSSITGALVFRALTPLICASPIISNNVECLIEYRAGDDFRVAGLTDVHWFPTRFQQDAPTNERVVEQGGEYTADFLTFTRTQSIMNDTPPSITGNRSDVSQMSVENFTIGEQFNDFTSLTRRFAFMFSTVKAPKTTFRANMVDFVRPPFITFKNSTQEKGGTTYEWVSFVLSAYPSPLSFVASMYTFVRGSIRNKIYWKEGGDLISARIEGGQALTDSKISAFSQFNSPVAFEQPGQKKFAEFQFPYYSPTLLTVPYPDVVSADTLFSQPIWKMVVGTSDMEEDSTLFFAAAAGDDMTFHMFLGVPPCLEISLFSDEFTLGATNQESALFFNPELLQVNPCEWYSPEESVTLNNPTLVDAPLSIKDFKAYDTLVPTRCKGS